MLYKHTLVFWYSKDNENVRLVTKIQTCDILNVFVIFNCKKYWL